MSTDAGNGGRLLADLTGFQRDLLRIAQKLQKQNEQRSGVEILERMEAEYGEEITNPRVYTNLNELDALGLINKVEDGDTRGNEYFVTPKGRQVLREEFDSIADVLPSTDCGHNGGGG